VHGAAHGLVPAKCCQFLLALALWLLLHLKLLADGVGLVMLAGIRLATCLQW